VGKRKGKPLPSFTSVSLLRFRRKAKSAGVFNQSLPYAGVGEKKGEAATLNNIGGVYYALGEKQKALEFYNQSLPLSRATGDKATGSPYPQ
jgi:tetratricopeptide (TPR) repeat protein